MTDKKLMFRKPNQIAKGKDTNWVNKGIRIKLSTLSVLQDAAKKAGISVNYLIGEVLDDYARFIKEKK